MKLKQLLAIAATFACASVAHAQSAGSILLGAGWMHFAPQSSSDPLVVNSVNGATNVPGFTGPQAGSGASVDGADTLGLTASYFFTDHIATEFVFGIPPKFELDGSGTLSPLGQLGTVKQYSPTLLLKYYFGQANATVRPYLGLGVSRVWFSDGTITNPGLSYQLTGGPGGTTSVTSIKSSWAPVFNGGLSYAFSKHWIAALSVSYLPLSTTAQFNSVNPVTHVTTVSSAHITLNPIVSYLSISYRF